MSEDIFTQAVKMHIDGRLQEASQKYIEIIQKEPYHGPAHNNLGTILGYRQGLDLFRLATQISPYDDRVRENFNKAILENVESIKVSGAWVLKDLAIINTKKSTALREAGRIDNLVVGSSHGDHAFNSMRTGNSINLCYTSQDLLQSSCIHDWASHELPRVKNVIVFYSVFSSCFSLQMTDERWRVALYREIFGFDYTRPDEMIDRTYAIISGWAAGYSTPNDQFGFSQQFGDGRYFAEDYGVARRAENHFSEKRASGQTLHLVRILLRARELGQRVLVVIPPYRPDLRAVLNQRDRYFQELHWVRDQFSLIGGFEIIDFYDDPFFQFPHFGDYDHLNPQGEGCRYLTDTVMARLS